MPTDPTDGNRLKIISFRKLAMHYLSRTNTRQCHRPKRSRGRPRDVTKKVFKSLSSNEADERELTLSILILKTQIILSPAPLRRVYSLGVFCLVVNWKPFCWGFLTIFSFLLELDAIQFH
ncbi:hypothetical protein CDAR_552611 [Caerostris darwini]|uniref:Uncharacterized protein n=1 Tax=Caerostris darwini TaxID=1538125 RepID=A0AAV4S4Z9_9ARAC|nr:hypothetical protein CDAR_552611 [Caerostris darwini]